MFRIPRSSSRLFVFCLILAFGLGISVGFANTPNKADAADKKGTLQNSTVRCYESQITIPTYPWQGHDDINPMFRWTSNPGYSNCTTIYPYPMQDNLSSTKKDVTYKTLVLENEYLKLTVTPDLGGHVQSILDKVTGENMLYENKVLKPSLIGLRGAWASGGIEFNTGPQGHTVTCLSPVEAAFVDFGDGSKGIAIGNVEQVYHTQWVVTVRLYPGRSFVEERIRIYNPTRNQHVYYFWNCVAMPNTESTQFIYPMTLGQDHAGTTFFNWPIHNGKDISWLKNFSAPTSIFSYQCDQDFYGSYDHNLDRGVITHADHFELEGKKSWTWSKSPWGLRAQAALTDDGSCYNEIQTGPLPTQADYGLSLPQNAVEWREWWYPVRGTKGVVFSNKDVSANVERHQDQKTITLWLHSTGTWDATCSVDGQNGVAVKLSPAKAISVTLPCKEVDSPVQILVSSGAKELLNFTYPLALPKRTPPENPRALPGDNTAAGCWLRGVQADKEGGTHMARGWYEKALALDANFAACHTALGELDLAAGQYESARSHLEKSLKINLDDGWTMYYLAQSYLELRMIPAALDMAFHACRKPETACPAYTLAGSIFLRQQEYAKALNPLHKAIEKDDRDIVSRNLLAYTLWKTGAMEGARQLLDEVWSRDPLDIPSGVIADLMGTRDEDFVKRIAGRKEEILDATDFFCNSGLYEEAKYVLKKFYLDADKKESTPLPYYYYGILCGDDKSLATAQGMSPDFVFPNLRSSYAILQQVVKKQPKDWKARLYLGNFLFENCQKEQAVQAWQDALKLNDSYSVLHRNLGLVAWKIDNDYWKAVACYERALACNPEDFPLYRDLASIYMNHTQQYVKACALLEKAREKKCKRADIAVLLGRAYLNLGEYGKAIAMLTGDSFTNWEGQGSLYTIYNAARIGLGEQLYRKGDYNGALREFRASVDYPQNLGAGQMDDAPDAESRYWLGMALNKLGKKAEASKEWQLAAGQSAKGDAQNIKFAKQAAEALQAH